MWFDNNISVCAERTLVGAGWFWFWMKSGFACWLTGRGRLLGKIWMGTGWFWLGFGMFSWRDGKKYQGFWKNGKKEGIGISIDSDGFHHTDIWLAGKIVKKRTSFS